MRSSTRSAPRRRRSTRRRPWKDHAYADASAIARQRLKQGIFEVRDAALRAQAGRDRKLKIVIGVVIAAIVLLVVALNVAFSSAAARGRWREGDAAGRARGAGGP